ncbi:hypothetical protein AAG906_018579 [Vitis piasezkii]
MLPRKHSTQRSARGAARGGLATDLGPPISQCPRIVLLRPTRSGRRIYEPTAHISFLLTAPRQRQRSHHVGFSSNGEGQPQKYTALRRERRDRRGRGRGREDFTRESPESGVFRGCCGPKPGGSAVRR